MMSNGFMGKWGGELNHLCKNWVIPVESSGKIQKGGAEVQIEITKSSDLLDSNGVLIQRGWAKDLLLRYNRERIRASKLKIKEWDYYCILTEEYGAAFTIADLGYAGMGSVTFLDLTEPGEITQTVITGFPMGKLNMPTTSNEGNVSFEHKNLNLEFIKDGRQRLINVFFANFADGKPLQGTIRMTQPKPMDTMVIATPFAGNPHAFYYNQKINCMPAEGILMLGSEKRAFDPARSFAVLDWGRGVWTYSNTWYWGSASGLVDGTPFGFNIGYGFGDTSCASENMLFYNNKAHKLDQVQFHIPPDDYLAPWKFTSNDRRFEMDFYPIIDRNADINALFFRSNQHQVFGRFTGRAVLDDGTVIELKDFLGFAEEVKNRW